MDARDSVIELALRLAEKIIHRQLLVDRHVIIDQVTAALKSLTGATNLSIHINPEDRPVMTEVMPELHETFSQYKHMRIVDDANIGRGGCILIHEHGRLNATLETQLSRAVELLLPGDLAVDPQPLVETDTESLQDDAVAMTTEPLVVDDMPVMQETPQNTVEIDAVAADENDPLSQALDQVDDVLKSTPEDFPEEPQA